MQKGRRKESSREQILDVRRALSFCSKMTAGILWEAAGRGKGGQEEKQSYQETSVCGGMKPTTISLTLLVRDECMEGIKSIKSSTACVVIVRMEKEEMSQQLSHHWELKIAIADKVIHVNSKVVPDLGEGGRKAEGLRAGSCCQSPEPKSVPRPGSLVSQGFLCRAMPAAAPKAASWAAAPCGASCKLLGCAGRGRWPGWRVPGFLPPAWDCGTENRSSSRSSPWSSPAQLSSQSW